MRTLLSPLAVQATACRSSEYAARQSLRAGGGYCLLISRLKVRFLRGAPTWLRALGQPRPRTSYRSARGRRSQARPWSRANALQQRLARAPSPESDLTARPPGVLISLSTLAPLVECPTTPQGGVFNCGRMFGSCRCSARSSYCLDARSPKDESWQGKLRP